MGGSADSDVANGNHQDCDGRFANNSLSVYLKEPADCLLHRFLHKLTGHGTDNGQRIQRGTSLLSIRLPAADHSAGSGNRVRSDHLNRNLMDALSHKFRLPQTALKDPTQNLRQCVHVYVGTRLRSIPNVWADQFASTGKENLPILESQSHGCVQKSRLFFLDCQFAIYFFRNTHGTGFQHFGLLDFLWYPLVCGAALWSEEWKDPAWAQCDSGFAKDSSLDHSHSLSPLNDRNGSMSSLASVRDCQHLSLIFPRRLQHHSCRPLLNRAFSGYWRQAPPQINLREKTTAIRKWKKNAWNGTAKQKTQRGTVR